MGAFGLVQAQKIADALLEMLFSSFPARTGEDGVWEVASAFSGGLDSTVLTAAALRHFGSAISIAPVVVGVLGGKDLKAAATAAEELGLGLELEEVVLGPADVLEAVPEVVGFTGSLDPVVISFTIPVYFVLRTEGPHEVLIGHGGDELFGGYARYVGIPPSELQGHLDADLEIAIERVGADRRMARSLGRELVTPFLSKAFVEKVRALPPELKVSGDERKVALRMMARSLGLSDSLAERKKTAAQYGSGVMKVLKSESKRRGLSKVADLVKLLSKR
jgi:asparagine synthase (glutamine-hydrolysing)